MHSSNLLHSRHLQWLRVQHVKGQTGDLCSIYKSMVAGARRTEADEKGGEWRPVPLVIPGETWAWTLPGRTDLSWTDSVHYYVVHWGIYMADWQTLGVQARGYNYFFTFTDLTTVFSLGTKKAKNKDLDRTMNSTFQPCARERVCVSLFSWLAVFLLPGNIMRL